MKTTINRLILLVILLSLGTVLVYRQTVERNNVALEIIKPEISLSMLGDTGITGKQYLTFLITLENKGKRDLKIDSVEPVFNENFSVMLEKKENKVVINETLKPYEIIEVKGEVTFIADGLSHEQIIDLLPFITEYKVTVQGVEYSPFIREF
jgi:hypothetical protein